MHCAVHRIVQNYTFNISKSEWRMTFILVVKVAVGTETSTEMSGRCYQHRCNSSDHVTVRVGQSPWLSCPSGQHIQVCRAVTRWV